MPKATAVTTEPANPTRPTTYPQRPNASATGMKLGSRLTRPKRRLRKAIIRITEISAMAREVPVSMLLMFRWDK